MYVSHYQFFVEPPGTYANSLGSVEYI